ncbi:MAG: hypothetical protein CJBNEKGG_00206 [Prosthecobacter sp.]|nr:hypothetical protein [Prosthecobacter sp.]
MKTTYRKMKGMMAGVAVLGAAVLANAEPSTEATILRITGSTAFRSATHSAIVSMFDSAPKAGYAGSSLSGSGRSFFYGTVGGQQVIITTSWSGSTGGIQVVAGAIPVGFLADTLADSTSTPVLATAGANATGGTQISSSSSFGSNLQVADVAMGDSYQAATPFKAPVLSSTRVGVIGFKWLVNRGLSSGMVSKGDVSTTLGSAQVTMADTTGIVVGMHVKGTGLPTNTHLKVVSVDSGTQVTLSANATATGGPVTATFATPAPITNINTQLAQALWSNGTASLAQFTGNAADSGTLVYATGRDPDSGTRLITFAESGIGVDSTVTQYKPTVSGGVITALAPYPQQVVNGITFTEGNGGESSGGTLVGYFGNVSNLGYLISYVSTGDAPTAINAGAQELTYNGVPFSLDAIKNGSYTFWCYQHVMYQQTLATAKKNLANTMADKITTTYAPIKLSEMNCSRTADGGVVFHN